VKRGGQRGEGKTGTPSTPSKKSREEATKKTLGAVVGKKKNRGKFCRAHPTSKNISLGREWNRRLIPKRKGSLGADEMGKKAKEKNPSNCSGKEGPVVCGATTR